MQEYVINVHTLTDIMPGSGESVPGIIDNDSRFDEYGLPYMNAKTLKGHLREQMVLIREVTPDEKIKAVSVDSLLGAQDPQARKKPGKVYVSDLRLTDNIRRTIADAIRRGLVTKEEIQDSLTFIYANTKINDEGVAEDHTLRKSRLIRKGLDFQAVLTAEDLSEEEYALLEKSVRAIQHIGTFKSKGKGVVSCTLCRKNNSGNQADPAGKEKNA